ncbi:MAG: NUDIX hydrolase [Gemmataceae bacterium]|nr:NUDIX hydrolase [Gemmataceae bacterium]MCI0741785.1 NUDIX hydrolase [Gemmataceae bacterium]
MANDADFVRQAAALPMRNGRVCLVTSSNGKRWVIPKGLIEPGQTAGETALQEAWEEAGLVGVLQAEPIGSYIYEKWCGRCLVTVFVMHVTDIAQNWPERELRQRVWLGPMSAIERIEDPGLVDLVRLATGKNTRDKVVLGH